MKRILLFIATLSIACWLPAYSCAAPIFNQATGHWYDTVMGDWFTAEANAIALGGHLVTINNAEEQAWLNSKFDTSILYLIGLNDIANEGNWAWVNREPVTYANWWIGEPNNWTTAEDVAVMNWQGNGRWNDWCSSCSNIGIAEFATGSVAEFATGSVPEPGTLLLLISGMTGLFVWKRRPGRL